MSSEAQTRIVLYGASAATTFVLWRKRILPGWLGKLLLAGTLGLVALTWWTDRANGN